MVGLGARTRNIFYIALAARPISVAGAAGLRLCPLDKGNDAVLLNDVLPGAYWAHIK